MPDAAQFATYARLLRLTPVLESTVTAPATLTVTDSSRKERSGGSTLWRKGLVSLFFLAVLPSCIGISYFWLLAADRYQSEARFVLRMPGRALANAAMANLAQASGVTRATEEGYFVQQFLESRDALTWLDVHAHIADVYGVANQDPVFGFPSPIWSNTKEGLYHHFLRMTSVDFDSTTGVTTLKVQAFSPADAQRLTASLLNAAEELVNRLNERARRDAIRLAEAEEARMRRRALTAQAALTEFRERERLVDPKQATLAVLETIATLSSEAAQVSVHISELSKSSPGAPQISPLRARRAALETQITIERQRLAGDAESIAPRIAEYERLMLEREFGEKALLSAMTAVETARVESLRQHVYLERIAAPSRPDYAAYPWRVLWCLGIAAAGLMAWRLWRLIVADAFRHSQK